MEVAQTCSPLSLKQPPPPHPAKTAAAATTTTTTRHNCSNSYNHHHTTPQLQQHLQPPPHHATTTTAPTITTTPRHSSYNNKHLNKGSFLEGAGQLLDLTTEALELTHRQPERRLLLKATSVTHQLHKTFKYKIFSIFR